ncbi:hypothetical protein AAG570_003728 [Ranatra chinensis]|uniref:Uncharacterized protein n=1 Tax=Ranatra chinensis TaxID=642074 RepID=A0ABD0YMI1_9HEMI
MIHRVYSNDMNYDPDSTADDRGVVNRQGTRSSRPPLHPAEYLEIVRIKSSRYLVGAIVQLIKYESVICGTAENVFWSVTGGEAFQAVSGTNVSSAPPNFRLSNLGIMEDDIIGFQVGDTAAQIVTADGSLPAEHSKLMNVLELTRVPFVTAPVIAGRGAGGRPQTFRAEQSDRRIGRRVGSCLRNGPVGPNCLRITEIFDCSGREGFDMDDKDDDGDVDFVKCNFQRFGNYGFNSSGKCFSPLSLNLSEMNLTGIARVRIFIYLKYLDVTKNRLTLDALSVISGMDLVKIVADRNKITSAQLPTMKHLWYLSLKKNKIEYAETECQPHLKMLYLDGKHIEYFTWHSLLSLKKNVSVPGYEIQDTSKE